MYRKDEVHVQPIHPNVNNPANQYDFPGCIFLVEDVAKLKEADKHKTNKRFLYLTWAPYTLLNEINGNSKPSADFDDVLPAQSQSINSASGYVSAQINPNASSPLVAGSKIKKKKSYVNQSLYAFASPLHDIASIKRHIPSMGKLFAEKKNKKF